MSDPPPAQSSREQHRPLNRGAYHALAEFRYLIRRFLEFGEIAARHDDLTPVQHQALLAIAGFPGDEPPTVGNLAERLRIQHHSAVELADRLAQAGLIVRRHDTRDRRRVLIGLTEAAERRLADLSVVHLEELRRLRPTLLEILERIDACSGSVTQR